MPRTSGQSDVRPAEQPAQSAVSRNDWALFLHAEPPTQSTQPTQPTQQVSPALLRSPFLRPVAVGCGSILTPLAQPLAAAQCMTCHLCADAALSALCVAHRS